MPRRRRIALMALLGGLVLGSPFLSSRPAGAAPASRSCGHALVSTVTERVELYFRTRHTACGVAKRVVQQYFHRAPDECVGSGCFITLPSRWRCHAAPGAVSEKDGPVTQCSREHGRQRILTSRFAHRGFEPAWLVRRKIPARPPKMLYPTLDYGSRTGGTLWHGWIKPHRWDDGDDVAVIHARWVSWSSRRAVARVRAVIAGTRGHGTVTLSDPGYCRAAHTYGYLKETDRGGPWGRGGTIDLREQCESPGPEGRVASIVLRPHRLPTLNDGRDFRVKPATLAGWTFDGSQVFGGPSDHPPHGYFPGGSVGRINWASWTDHHATGEGVVWTDDCEPSCGNGRWQPSPTLVTAYRPRRGTFQRMRFVCDCDEPVGTRARLRLKGELRPQWEIVRQW